METTPTRDQVREAMRRGRRRVPLAPVEAPLPTEREDAMLDEVMALLDTVDATHGPPTGAFTEADQWRVDEFETHRVDGPDGARVRCYKADGTEPDPALAVRVAAWANERALVGGRSAHPADDEAIYNDVKTELGIALGWGDDSDPDDVRDWRHDLVTRVIALAQPSRPAAEPPEHQIDALLERVDAWVESVEGTPTPWVMLCDMADLLRRLRGMTADPPSEAAGFIYDPESDRWCCIACEQWSDEGADVGTIAHADHSGVAAEPNEGTTP